MNGKGYIKLPRSLLNEWRDTLTSEEIGIMVQLMAMANYEKKPKQMPEGNSLERGQLVLSVRWFAKRFDMSKSKAERMLDRWEALGLIKRKTVFGTQSGTPIGTLVTLEFYAFSQGTRDNRSQDRNEDVIRNNKKENVVSQQDLQALREKHRTGGTTIAETVPDIFNTKNPQPAAEGAACRSDRSGA